MVALPFLNRVDHAWLGDLVSGARRVITLDNHYVDGGQGQMLASALAELGASVPVTRVGVDALLVCGTNDEVLAHHRLDVEGLVERVQHLL